MARYKLKEGVILRPFGVNSKLDNSNLTDNIAELLIKKGRANKEDFIIATPKRTKQKQQK